MALDQRNLSRLCTAKLRALARKDLGLDIVDVGTFTHGAIGSTDPHVAPRMVVCLAETAAAVLGKALAARSDRSGEALHVLCAVDAGIVARRAEEFDVEIHVWEIRDSGLLPAEPRAHERPAEIDKSMMGLLAEIVAMGADPVVEHGSLIGEVRGLEIMRGHGGAESVELRVGVGDFDQEMFAMMHGARPSLDVVAEVVATVAEHRRHGAEPHPLNRIAPERWLRSVLIENPSRIGLDRLVAVEPPVPRTSIKEIVPAVAIGRREGSDVVVVISSGIDLELVPFAADARLRTDRDADLLVVVPQRDAHRITVELAGSLHRPAEIVTVADDWRD